MISADDNCSVLSEAWLNFANQSMNVPLLQEKNIILLSEVQKMDIIAYSSYDSADSTVFCGC